MMLLLEKNIVSIINKINSKEDNSYNFDTIRMNECDDNYKYYLAKYKIMNCQENTKNSDNLRKLNNSITSKNK